MARDESIDWSTVSFEGSRSRQQELFRALPLREKLLRLEQMAEVVQAIGPRGRSIPDAASRDPGAAEPLDR